MASKPKWSDDNDSEEDCPVELQIIRKHRKTIAGRINAVDLLDYFIPKMFTKSEREKIKCESTNNGETKAAHQLLDFLIRKPGGWFGEFLAALENDQVDGPGYGDIVDILQEDIEQFQTKCHEVSFQESPQITEGSMAGPKLADLKGGATFDRKHQDMDVFPIAGDGLLKSGPSQNPCSINASNHSSNASPHQKLLSQKYPILRPHQPFTTMNTTQFLPTRPNNFQQALPAQQQDTMGMSHQNQRQQLEQTINRIRQQHQQQRWVEVMTDSPDPSILAGLQQIGAQNHGTPPAQLQTCLSESKVQDKKQMDSPGEGLSKARISELQRSFSSLCKYESLKNGGGLSWCNGSTSSTHNWATLSSVSTGTSFADSIKMRWGENSESGNVSPITTSNSNVYNPNKIIHEFVPGKPWQGMANNVTDDSRNTPGNFSRSLSENSIEESHSGNVSPIPTSNSNMLSLNNKIQEFVPGKPWQGMTNNVTDDSHNTPGSFSRFLSVNSIKESHSGNVSPITTSSSNMLYPDKKIHEFVPGKLCQGMTNNVTDDSHNTPGNFSRFLSVNCIKESQSGIVSPIPTSNSNMVSLDNIIHEFVPGKPWQGMTQNVEDNFPRS